MLVLAFGTYDTSTHPRFGVLLAGLRRGGADVVEINEPLGLSTADRVQMLRQPWRVAQLAARLVNRWTRLVRRSRRELRRGGSPDVVAVGYLGHFDVLLARLLFRSSTLVLDHLIFAADTAVDRGERGSAKTRLLHLLDLLALHCADVVVLDTEEHRQLVPPGLQEKVVVCPVGAPDAWFAAGAGTVARRDESAADEPLRLVFFGLFTPLQGAEVIGRAAALLAGRTDVCLTMIGSGQDLRAAREAAAGNPRVRWLPWVEADRLPAEIAAHDICLGIFGTTSKAARVVPNKVYQGAAAGLAIVTSDTRPQRHAFPTGAVFVPPGDPGALAAAIAELADDRARVTSLRRQVREHAESTFTSTAVTAPLSHAIERGRGSRPRRRMRRTKP